MTLVLIQLHPGLFCSHGLWHCTCSPNSKGERFNDYRTSSFCSLRGYVHNSGDLTVTRRLVQALSFIKLRTAIACRAKRGWRAGLACPPSPTLKDFQGVALCVLL